MKKDNFTAFFLMALLLLGAVGALFAYPPAFKDIRRMTFSQFLEGETTVKFEDTFDKNLPHYQLSVDTWKKLDYTLFKEGDPGVLVGTDGWLYTAEEFYGGADFEKNFSDNIDHITHVRDVLKKKNIDLLIVPVPAKARIYPEHLGRYEYPAHWHDNYRKFLNALEVQQIPHVDLLPAFEANKDRELLFLRTDTHWAPPAARITAEIVAAQITSDFPYLQYETKQYKIVPWLNDEYYGDLMSFVANDAWGVKPEMLQSYQIEGVVKDESYRDTMFATEDLPIVLAGTSYSANPVWGFEYFLKAALQGDILNVSLEQIGPFYVMRSYLLSQPFMDKPPKLIIWEMPERYMSSPLLDDLRE